MSIGSSGRGWGLVCKHGCSSGRRENRTATTLRAPAIAPCDLYGLHLGARRSSAPFLKALGEAFHMGRTRTDGSRADGRKNAEELAPLGESHKQKCHVADTPCGKCCELVSSLISLPSTRATTALSQRRQPH